MASRIKDKDQIQQGFLPFGPLGQKFILSRLTKSHLHFSSVSWLSELFSLQYVSEMWSHTYHKFSFKLT